jgi:hypothetical protein
VTIIIGANTLQDINQVAIPAGSLIELVNLGADGVFDPIDLDASGSSPWVSGDDSLVTAPFTVGGQPGDFSSAAAFDLEVGPDNNPGDLERTFTFNLSDLPAGTKLGIRWFPGLQASNFSLTTGPAAGQTYGEFTRQSNPLYDDAVWVVTPGTDDFDSLVTQSAGGSDPNSAGVANLLVVPEPTSWLMLLAGGSLLLCRRPRGLRAA